VSSSATTIAFYLPQYYPIPENDGWYGTGFTEWHNVVQAKPLFAGHYQPHLPKDFSFYDLRVPEVREAQARTAKAHGVDAFCYYHYWFEGQRPLRRIVDEVLKYGSPNMTFCLAWANENWSRHWDASEHEILLTQRYSPEDDEVHGQFLLEAMSHPLYLRVNGRPVLFIYRLQALPEPRSTIRRWRELWRSGGIEDVEVIKIESYGHMEDPALFGADSAAQFIPGGTEKRVRRIYPPGINPGNAIFDYEDLVQEYLRADPPAWRRHECVVPCWDNSPRRGDGQSFVLHGSTPELYGHWLREVYRRTPPDGLVLINAWNEWAEGAHLEPDLRYGSAYLQATATALGVARSAMEVGLSPKLISAPFAMQDRLADQYLDAFEMQTRLQRRLSRLEATLNRQITYARAEAAAETEELRGYLAILLRQNRDLRDRLGMLAGDRTDSQGMSDDVPPAGSLAAN
jgi:Glycosyltransferase WbsX